MELQEQEGWQGMTDVVRNFPLPWQHGQFEHCLQCGSREIGFKGGFRPSEDTAPLWADPSRPAAHATVRFFALCVKHWRIARKSKMASVDRYLKQQMATERVSTVH